MRPKPPQSAVIRAARMIAFLAKNPLRQARSIIAACVAEELVRAGESR